MKTLAIDTSNNVMGVAIIDDNRVIGEYVTNVQKNHSVRVMPAINQLLRDCDIKPKEVEKIVVAAGPGSYTGVRIGVTIAKTLAWSLNIPLVGVSSLEALAANGIYFAGHVVPLFDARRGQVYTGLYKGAHGELHTVKEDRIQMLNEYVEELKDVDGPILFIGNDVALHQDTIIEALGDKAVFAQSSFHHPKPSGLALIGRDKEASDVHAFVPNYIRLAEAEANWLAEQKKKELK
jgi:tRNA threonylcarbamoyladenosine biosynthesis protein TsaB